MLPRRHRMRTSAQFAEVLREGRRGGTATLVVHALPRTRASEPGDAASPVIVGFIVGKSVGNSVVRHRVSRQLRAAMSPRIGELGTYRGVVVRALAPAAGRASAELNREIDAALRRVGEPRRRRTSSAAQAAPALGDEAGPGPEAAPGAAPVCGAERAGTQG